MKKTFSPDLLSAKKEDIYYTLTMFPYPSGYGLHAGHASVFTYNDVNARYQRMKGKVVLNPFGFDSFGLPTENFAMQQGKPAWQVTEENIKFFMTQIEALDMSFDLERIFATSDPEYYKWTQWIFVKLYEAGLVYRAEKFVNRCNGCQTVLANDQVVEGLCERCKTEIIQKKHPQWFIKITDYAERLIDDLDGLDRPEETKQAQKNWIGKSVGAEIVFQISPNPLFNKRGEEHQSTIAVFTTRPDTIYGVTAIVLAPENTLIDAYMDDIYKQKVLAYRKESMAKTAVQRQQDTKEKSGVHSGIFATHPLTGEQIPVWFADYVLMDYGTGAVMFVPAHDERDREFAEKNGLTIKQVIQDTTKILENQDNPLFYPNNEQPHPNPLQGEGVGTSTNVSPRGEGAGTHVGSMIRSNERNQKDIYNHYAMSSEHIKERAKELRKNQTKAEEIFWEIVRDQQVLKTKWRRQHPFKYYVADFYCQDLQLVVEIDGDTHNKDTKEYDERRTAFIEEFGISVLRFTNEDIYKHRDSVYTKLKEICSSLIAISSSLLGETLVDVPAPSPWRGLGGGCSLIECYTGTGLLINSEQFTGLDNISAKKAITTHLESLGAGKAKITYRLRDWSVSRQRYWGSPIPMYYDENNTPHPIPVSELPVILPRDIENYKPKGKSPLEDHATFPTYYPQLFGSKTNIITVNTYNSKIENYILRTEAVVGGEFQQRIDGFLTKVKKNGKILELGSGIGRDAKYIESHGFQVTRTDGSQGFVDHLQNQGYICEKFNLLENFPNLGGKFDAIFANAVLLHFTDEEITYILNKIKAYIYINGVIYMSFKIGEGQELTSEKMDSDRFFNYFSEEKIKLLLNTAGYTILDIQNDGKWMGVIFEYSKISEISYRRECDTLDTFMCSSFYFLRFPDTTNNDELIRKELAEKMFPIDLYTGGKEHTVGHLLYSRFIHKFLYDQGYLPCAEPFAKLVHQGYILGPDGRKMGKRYGNVIDPIDVVNQYGSDAVKTYLMFMGPVDQEKIRNDNALKGIKKFLDRIERACLTPKTFSSYLTPDPSPTERGGEHEKIQKSLESLVHKTIKGMTHDLEQMKYNTAVSKLMILLNAFEDAGSLVSKDIYEQFLLMLCPFAPKTAQQIWTVLGHDDDITELSRPSYDPEKVVESELVIPIQINGKRRGEVFTPAGCDEATVMDIFRASETFEKYIGGETIKKVIWVKDKILNVVL